MKTKLLLLFCLGLIWQGNAQSTINITTSGGNYASEKWVNITTLVDGEGTQVWGQGNGTYGDGAGLIDTDITIAPGTYFVNCYDIYSDGWDGTLISVSAYTIILGNNGRVSPSDAATMDTDGTWETPEVEIEASFQIIVPVAPTCLPVSAINVSTITATSANINWTNPTTSVDFNWEIQPQGTTQGTAGAISGTGASTGVTAGGLTETTDYDVFVQTNCGGSDLSGWAGPISFSTPCAIITPDYNEDFTTYLNPCWSESKGLLSATTTVMTSTSSNWISDGFANGGTSGAAKINIYGTGRKERLISPSIDLGTSANLQLEFDIALTDYGNANATVFGADDTLAIVISTDNGTTWNTTNILQYWTAGSEPSNIGDNIVIDLSTYTGVVQFGFYAASSVSNEDNDLSIDNFWVRTPPACANPSALNVSNISDSDVVLNWTNSITGAAVDYNWEIQPQGIAQGTAGSISGTGATTGVIAGGLTETTDYDVFIQTNCAGPLSTWFGPVSFTTICSVITPDYNEDFTTYLNQCWSESKGLLSATNTVMTSTSSNWISDGFANIGTSGAAKINIYGTGRAEWLISPSIDLGTSANLQLEFDIALTAYGNTNATVFGTDDTLAIIISTDNGVTWNTTNILQSWTAGSEPSNTGDNIVIDLSTYTGVVQFGFYAASSVSNEDNDLSIDNFWVRTPPACSVPTALSVSNTTTTSTDINWTNSVTGSALDYNWEIQPVGVAQGTAGSISGTGASTGVTAGGLTAFTNYDVFIQTNCGGDNSLWVGPVSFKTLGDCSSNGTFDYTNNSSLNSSVNGFVAGTPDDHISLDFTTGTTETNYDDWFINDAADGSGNTIATGDGSIVGIYTSTTGEISFYVESDGVTTGDQFTFTTSCFTPVLVTSINVQGQGGVSTITTNAGTLQMEATILPINATDSTYTWSVANGTGAATIDATGILTASANGDVTVTATANDASGLTGTAVITISNQAVILVTQITVQGQGGVSTISTNAGTLQMEATVLPTNATDGTYTWSVTNGTGAATIDVNGLLTASSDGDVTVTATANDASGLTGDTVITISNQDALVTSITVQGQGGVSTITLDDGTLQREATVLPANVTDGTYTWSLANGTGQATIDATGLLTATHNGDVIVTATANDASGVTGTVLITITNQTSVGVDENGNLSISIFPNPTQHFVNIITAATIKTINVYNIDGKLVLTDNAENNILNIKDLANGSYLIVINTTDGLNHTSRIVKQ